MTYSVLLRHRATRDMSYALWKQGRLPVAEVVIQFFNEGYDVVHLLPIPPYRKAAAL